MLKTKACGTKRGHQDQPHLLGLDSVEDQLEEGEWKGMHRVWGQGCARVSHPRGRSSFWREKKQWHCVNSLDEKIEVCPSKVMPDLVNHLWMESPLSWARAPINLMSTFNGPAACTQANSMEQGMSTLPQPVSHPEEEGRT